MTLTVERLREVLDYDPTTGVFTWKVSYRKTKAGDTAGTDSHGYRAILIDGKLNRAHRLAWLYVNGVWPVGMLDHKNRVRSDNRIDNLRPAGGILNGQNRLEAQKNNKTGMLGVSPKRNKFRARIKVNGKQKQLGTFDTAEQAHAAYLEAKRKLHPGCTI